MRSRLPELRRETVGVSREETRDKDWSIKLEGKAYTDDKRCVEPRSIRIGDTVLLRAEEPNKLSGNFCPSPFKVAQKRGSEIPVRNDMGVSSFLKKCYQPEDASATGGGACTAEYLSILFISFCTADNEGDKKESAAAGTEEGKDEEDRRSL